MADGVVHRHGFNAVALNRRKVRRLAFLDGADDLAEAERGGAVDGGHFERGGGVEDGVVATAAAAVGTVTVAAVAIVAATVAVIIVADAFAAAATAVTTGNTGQQCGGSHLAENIKVVVAGRAVGAERDIDAVLQQRPHRADAGRQFHV